MGRRMPKSKIHSPAVGGFPQSDVLFYNCLLWAFTASELQLIWPQKGTPVKYAMLSFLKNLTGQAKYTKIIIYILEYQIVMGVKNINLDFLQDPHN